MCVGQASMDIIQCVLQSCWNEQEMFCFLKTFNEGEPVDTDGALGQAMS